VSPPEKREPGLGTRAAATPSSTQGPSYTAGQATVQISGPDGAPVTTTTSSGFGEMANRRLTTTRRCEGWACWCHVGATGAWPLDHYDEMARMAREIRRIEIVGGVVGA
jgi:hypothetical protein